jgi:Holliday junction DNA helicase RuvA
MIARIRGEVVEKTSDALVVECAGVGYELYVRAEDWGSTSIGKQVTLQVYEHIREDAHTLFGFAEPEAKRLFVQLIGVNGVGPKVAMAILGAANLKQLQSAIATGDPELLRGVSGVGKKTAERVMLELRGKLEMTTGAASNDPTYQALVALGYSSQQAAEAAASVPAEVTDEQSRIKAALKIVK